MLLSLVVIFTQSIQLSKIHEQSCTICIAASPLRALRRLEHSCSRFNLPAQLKPQKLNLKQTSLDSVEHANRENMVELNGIEPLTPCLQSRCSPN